MAGKQSAVYRVTDIKTHLTGAERDNFAKAVSQLHAAITDKLNRALNELGKY
jgi:hypothetical protein